MGRLRSRRGTNLVDVVITLFLTGMTGIIFASTFPYSFASSAKAQNYKLATAIAQRKMEQMRALSFESLNYAHLLSAQIIDSTQASSPYEFTTIDAVSSNLPDGKGTITIIDDSLTVRRVVVNVTWNDTTTRSSKSVELTTLFADKRPRGGT